MLGQVFFSLEIKIFLKYVDSNKILPWKEKEKEEVFILEIFQRYAFCF